ncbi:MAG: hypothetical protein A3G81_26220 [Betaproteobacteria bacterium RIFCSPLOWO2_12_FULL_65_14]|nr:MAG: hypothetical protein A3G81_26220 [Betaproteobacteria bacterium RIFCSPLOWO2_12_FULL_65_14]
MQERTRGARDFASLTEEILAACEPFGPVHSFKLVHNRGTSSVACVIELEAQKQQPALARALGARAVNGAVCLEIPVSRAFESGSHVVGMAPQPPYHDQVAT